MQSRPQNYAKMETWRSDSKGYDFATVNGNVKAAKRRIMMDIK